VDQDPIPNRGKAADEKDDKVAPSGSKPEPGEKPNPKDDEEPKDDKDTDSDDEKDDGVPPIFQGDQELAVEPPQGAQAAVPPPQAPTPPPQPRTPERIAAEKEVVKQIMATDDTTLSNVATPLNEALRIQLHELYRKADEMGFREAVTFLTPYVKP
jgi:hypothetical protein